MVAHELWRGARVTVRRPSLSFRSTLCTVRRALLTWLCDEHRRGAEGDTSQSLYAMERDLDDFLASMETSADAEPSSRYQQPVAGRRRPGAEDGDEEAGSEHET